MTENCALQAVLWDMDGVIVDTYEGHLLAWQQTLREVGLEFDEETFRWTFGMNNRLILNTVYGREVEEEFFQKMNERKETIFRKNIKGKVKPLPGVTDWLQRFKEMDIKQAVASSAPQENIEALLTEMGIRGFFQAEAAGGPLQGKPNPAVFLLAAELLGVDPLNCLVIEDSIVGVEAARRAGSRCVAVLTTNQASELTQADLIVKDLTFFTPEMLKGLF